MPTSDPCPASVSAPLHRRRAVARRLLIALAVLALLPVALVRRSVARGDYEGAVKSVALDLERPDALVRTRSLSELPRDLLGVPLFRDLLSEDFVFYYEGDPDRLGLQGSLRRIAYEHDLRWRDDFVAWVLDQPAEIALWRSTDGRLRHWLIAMTRGPLARVVEEAAAFAAGDRQLTQAAVLNVDGKERPVLALEYAPGRTLLVVASGDRVVVLSDPGVLLGENRAPSAGAAAVVTRLVSADRAGRAVYDHAFRLDSSVDHSVVVGLHYASFGYQRFFPGIEALRFDFGQGAWSTYALFDGSRLPAAGWSESGLWTALPANPAFCALLPVDWKSGAGVLEGAALGGSAAVLERLEGPAAVCWYARGLLQAPLFAAAFKSTPPEPLLQGLFKWAVAGARAEGAVRTQRVRGGVRWQRRISVPYAGISAEGEPELGPLDVALARSGRFVLFSPDGQLVKRALATLDKRYPSVADTLPGDGVTLAVLTPARLAELAKRDALLMLPRGSEPLFRGAAERLLLPRLATMARYPARRLVLADAGPSPNGWQAVTWQELAP